ncbi:hypothetical protein [Phytoactinopolyspora limicola]|uniref:hypothetical protein n=1 Tax=Phytoactinopolyspora limicola TaxID=2715536 RepID=UPI00140A656A|nr:hypothetical protein [Phytoactinopolyspora limicola]
MPEGNALNALTGTWHATLASPLGPISIVFEFAETDGRVHGTSTANAETVALSNVTIKPGEGGTLRATWGADVTRPVSVHLDFDVTVAGDTLTGSAKAGMLMPNGAVTGTRHP